MVVNTSRILTLGLQIPQVLVQNPDLITATPLSPTQIQVVARKTGVTQINLWDEKNQVHTIDVVVIGDARELTSLLNSEFPGASIKVRPGRQRGLDLGIRRSPRGPGADQGRSPRSTIPR